MITLENRHLFGHFSIDLEHLQSMHKIILAFLSLNDWDNYEQTNGNAEDVRAALQDFLFYTTLDVSDLTLKSSETC